MGAYTGKNKEHQVIASCTGEDCQSMIVQWVKDNGYTKDEVKILKSGETVWVEKLI